MFDGGHLGKNGEPLGADFDQLMRHADKLTSNGICTGCGG